jgi:hypothetical protein
MEAILSSETSVLTKTTRHQIPKDGFIHSHRRENLKSYILNSGFNIILIFSNTLDHSQNMCEFF